MKPFRTTIFFFLAMLPCTPTFGQPIAAQSVEPTRVAPPTTRPAATQPAAFGGFRGDPNRRFGPPRFFLPEQNVEQHIEAAEKFMKENSPNHFRAYQVMRDEERRQRLKNFLVRGYLDLQVVQANDLDLYDMKIHQIKLQDQIFQLITENRHINRIKENTRPDNTKLIEQLRPLEQEVLDWRKKESEHRLKRILSAAENERSTLSALNAMPVDVMIEQDLTSGDRIGPGLGSGRGGDR